MKPPVVGVGLDLLEVERLERAAGRWGTAFLERVFSPRELAEAGGGRDHWMRLAARFCAKEAVFKALGAGRPHLGWRDVEIVRGPEGAPEAILGGRALERARALGVERVLVSLTHLRGLAGAQAVAVAPGGGVEQEDW